MSDPVEPMPNAEFEENLQKASKEGYIHKDLVGLDQFVNVITDGNPDETISSRMARWATEENVGSIKHKIGTEACKVLNMFQKDHGAVAESHDLSRAEYVETVEESSPTVKEEQGS